MSKEYYAALQGCIEKNEEIKRLREENKKLKGQIGTLDELIRSLMLIINSMTEGGGE